MAYLTEAEVRTAARGDPRRTMRDAATILKEDVARADAAVEFDVFLCHSIRDAELVHGAKRILERQKLSVYVDWIVDPQMDRAKVNAGTAGILRARLRRSKSLFYLYSNNSTRSRWMPWELGFFDGHDGSVAILPIVPDQGQLNFASEEYLGLYPKIEIENGGVFVNRTAASPVPTIANADWMGVRKWMGSADKLRPS